MGANVFVISGSQEKLDHARDLGVIGGVIYKAENWEADICQQLPSSRPYIDAIIDDAGGDMVNYVERMGIRPVISRTVLRLDNIEAIDGLFEDMKAGRQTGKLVIEIDHHSSHKI